MRIEKERLAHHISQGQAQPIFANNANDAESRAPEGEGITAASWLFAHSKETDQLVNLIRQRYGNRHRFRWDGIASTHRAVMRGDGFRHAGILTLTERVIPPHHALQFGEFTHHAGSQISLRQARSAPGQCCIGAEFFRNQPGKLFKPRHALALRTKLGVKHHAIQLRQEAFQLLLAVQIPEETRIRQTRAQDTFIAGDNRRTAIRGSDIGNQRKSWRRRAIGLPQGEVALIDAHGGAHHLRR